MPNWGQTTALTPDTVVNWTRAMDGTIPNTEGMVLDSVSIYVGTTHSSQVRVAVYQGGSLGNPSSATLVYDFGLTSGTGTSQWLTLNTTGSPSLTADEVTWIMVKGNDSGFSVAYDGAGNEGDFDDSDGRYLSSVVSSNESTAYPSTWPTDSGTSADFWYSWYLTYSIGPVITDVDTDDNIYNGQEDIVITGSSFEADGANSRIRLNSTSAGTGTNVVQTDSAWSDTSITFDLNRGTLSYGTNYLFVRNHSLDENATGYAVVLYVRHYITQTDKANNQFRNGDSVTLTGANFSATQGTGEQVQLMDSVDGSGTNINQTVTSWSDTSITFTVVQSTLSTNEDLWLTVIRNESSLGDVTARRSEGLQVTLLSPLAFRLKLSTYFAHNDATTRQLTAQSGDFVPGKMAEANNPDQVSLQGENYTEIEYCFEPTTDAEAGEQYELRFVGRKQQGEKLYNYNKQPKLTISS